MTDMNKLLEERGETHGDYRVQFEIAIKIKKALSDGILVPDIVKEGLDMISTKLSRTVCGELNPDDFDDIAGYATIVANYIRGTTEKSNPEKDDMLTEREVKEIKDLAANLRGTQ